MPAEYGDRLGTVVNLSTRAGRRHSRGLGADALRLVQHDRAGRRVLAEDQRQGRHVRRRQLPGQRARARSAVDHADPPRRWLHVARVHAARLPRLGFGSLRAVRHVRAQQVRHPDRSVDRAARSEPAEHGAAGRSVRQRVAAVHPARHERDRDRDRGVRGRVVGAHVRRRQRPAPGRAAVQAVARRVVLGRGARARRARGSGQRRLRCHAQLAARGRHRRVLAPDRQSPVQGGRAVRHAVRSHRLHVVRARRRVADRRHRSERDAPRRGRDRRADHRRLRAGSLAPPEARARLRPAARRVPRRARRWLDERLGRRVSAVRRVVLVRQGSPSRTGSPASTGSRPRRSTPRTQRARSASCRRTNRCPTI